MAESKTINCAPDWVPLTKFYIEQRRTKRKLAIKNAEDFFLEMATKLDKLNAQLKAGDIVCLTREEYKALKK